MTPTASLLSRRPPTARISSLELKPTFMSKILEALKRTPSAPADNRTPATSQAREVQVEATGREWTQERLADIYFSATGKPKTSEPPVIIKVVERPRLAAWMPWLITSVAFLITAMTLFSTKRLLFEVRVIDDKTLLRSIDEEHVSPAVPAAANDFPGGEKKVETNEMLPLEDFTFEGAAILSSSRDPRRLTLVNSSVAPFARAVLRPDKPLDLSRAKLVFDVRGGKGGEHLAIAMKDRGNIQAFKKGAMQTFPEGLTTEWRQAEILLVDLNEEFDPKSVASVRFEFGGKDTANRSGDTVYVRNLRRVPLG